MIGPSEALSVDRIARPAAAYAVHHWHYSNAMPVSRSIYYGVWELGRYVGAVIYGRGGTPDLFKPYGLKQVEACELTRVALREHSAPVSQLISITLRDLKSNSPGLRLVLSYADPTQGHVGTIYQAGGWIYLGATSPSREYLVNGKQVHGRQINALRRNAIRSKSEYSRRRAPREGESTIEWIERNYGRVEPVMTLPKHRYVMPLDKAMRRQLTKLAMPYPRPCGQSLDGETPGPRSGSASSTLADRSI